MRTIKIFLFIATLFTVNKTVGQQYWKDSLVMTKSSSYKVRGGANEPTIIVERNVFDSKLELPFGISDEKGGASLYINSEKEFYKIFSQVFTPEKLKKITEVENRIYIGAIVDEEGIPVKFHYIINKHSLIAPDDIEKLDSLLKEKIRFKIVRKTPFGEPCVYPFSHILKFDELKNGEFPLLKRNELEGKKYW